MKTSKKMRIAGSILLSIGITFIIFGAAVLNKQNSVGWEPNFGLFIPGILLTIVSIFLIIISFIVDAAKGASKGISNLVGNISTKIMETRDALKYKVCPYCGFKNSTESGRCESCGGALK